MKSSEFAKWLKSKGVISKEGKKHTKLYCGTDKARCPATPQKLGTATQAIIKQLGLTDE